MGKLLKFNFNNSVATSAFGLTCIFLVLNKIFELFAVAEEI
jgi:hypothetical protein